MEEIMIYFGGYYCSPCMEIEKIYNEVYFMDLRYIKWRKMDTFKKEQPPPRYAHSAV